MIAIIAIVAAFAAAVNVADAVVASSKKTMLLLMLGTIAEVRKILTALFRFPQRTACLITFVVAAVLSLLLLLLLQSSC